MMLRQRQLAASRLYETNLLRSVFAAWQDRSRTVMVGCLALSDVWPHTFVHRTLNEMRLLFSMRALNPLPWLY